MQMTVCDAGARPPRRSRRRRSAAARTPSTCSRPRARRRPRRCRRPGCRSTSWPALARRDAGDDLRAVVAVAGRVERALAARDALHDEARLGCHEDGHLRRLPCELDRAPRGVEHRALDGTGWAGSRRRRSWRPSSSDVPSSRTTIGTRTSSRSSASRMPRATSSQRVMPPKMLKRIDRTFVSERMHLERGDDLLGLRSAADVEEVRGAAARLRDDVERRHHEPRPVAEDADLAVELDVGDAALARHLLLRVGASTVAHRGDVRVLVERVVVDRAPWRRARAARPRA